ncbi:MAG: hypothetical protein BVN35_04365 [Proteobacteria bacterium ST_bin11]|nr:MAG: hypothetical protein BVN35_04365 [Proteobacteria bacterium ST_bin11]
MKQTKCIELAVVAFSLIGFSTPSNASTQFAAAATIGFSVQSVRNESVPDNLEFADVYIDAGYEYRDALKPEPHRSSLIMNGDAILAVSDADYSMSGSYANNTSVFSHQFFVNGSVANGDISAFQLGWYRWSVTNNSATDIFSIDMLFDHQMSASRIGDYSSAVVLLDYFSDDDASFIGSDNLEAHAFAPSVQSQGGGSYSMTLNPGETKTYLVDVSVNANSVAAVPSPPAVWSFLLGMGAVLIRLPNKTLA